MTIPNSDLPIIVTGDIAMDWNLARTRRSRNDISFWSADDTASTTWQRGGSALLADLVEAIAEDLQKSGSARFSIRQTGAPRKSGQVQPDNDQYHHSYAMWSPFKYGRSQSWKGKTRLAGGGVPGPGSGCQRLPSRTGRKWSTILPKPAW